MPFTTRTAIKAALKVPSGVTQFDARIDDLADAANARILRELNLSGMTEATYTETLDVFDDTTRRLFLSRMPVQSVTAVSQAGAPLASTEWYSRRHGEVALKASGEFFVSGYQAVTVTYRAGFTNAAGGEGLPPGPLKEAATLLAVDGYNRGAMAGLASEASGQYNSTLAEGAVPPQVESILAGYRIPV